MAKVVKMKPARGATKPKTPAPTDYDPLNVNERLYNQVARLLTELERKDANDTLSIRERIAAMIAVGRLQTVFMGLRKEGSGDELAGSTVRKYATAFGPNDPGRGKKGIRGRTIPAEPTQQQPDWFERIGDPADGDSD